MPPHLNQTLGQIMEEFVEGATVKCSPQRGSATVGSGRAASSFSV